MIHQTIRYFFIFLTALFFFGACSREEKHSYRNNLPLPVIQMPKNALTFDEITGYQNYRVVATHYRTDKNELRYVLANEKAFRAFMEKRFPLPEGSKVVKIGWKANAMPRFGVAMEAGKIQRVEYMIKDSLRFSNNPGNWGYARFVKKEGRYTPWEKGTNSCISCHNGAGKAHDFLFSNYQKRF